MELDLMHATYVVRNDEPVIVLFGRGTDGKRYSISVKGFRPYFWAATKESDEKDIFGRPIEKVYCKLPSDVPTIRKTYLYHCEANIPFPLRFLIDKKIYCGFRVENGKIEPTADHRIPPKILFFDIEVLSPKEIFPHPDDPRWPIVSVQFANNYTDDIDVFIYTPPNVEANYSKSPTYECKHRKQTDVIKPNVHLYNDERMMLHAVVEYIVEQDPDVLTGYNCEMFDFPMLFRRAQRLHVPIHKISPLGKAGLVGRRPPPGVNIKQRERIEVQIQGREVVDLAAVYQKWTSGRQGVQGDEPFGLTFDFKAVVARETGFRYIDYGDRIEDIIGTDTMIEYATKDAYALRLLEEYCGLIDFLDNLRRIVGCPISWAISNKKLIDTLMLRIRDRPLPTESEGKKEDVRGALVIAPPRPGIFTNVAVFDLKSLYPSVIQHFNISPETKSPDGEIFVGPWRYRRRPEGIIPKTVRLLTSKREEYRAKLKKMKPGTPEYKRTKQLETLYKYLACSVYGVTGYAGFRLFDPDVTNSITYVGRESLTRIRRALKKMGFTLVYSDSVTPETPIFVKRDGLIDILPICEIYEGDYVWTATGWSRVKHVIRKPVRKPIVTVVTPEMIVNCTTDHSLIDPEGKPVKPYEAKRVMTKPYPKCTKYTQCDERLAWVLGLFNADGSKIGNQLVINGTRQLCEKAQHLLSELGVRSYLRDYRKSSRAWRLVISQENPFREFFEDTYTSTGWRKIPRVILNAPVSVVRAFLDGFYEGDFANDVLTAKYRYKFYSVDSKHPCIVVGLTFLVERLTGQSWNCAKARRNTGIQIRFRTPYKTRGPRRYKPGTVKSVRSITEYRWTKKPFDVAHPPCVYDLSTESETFCVGKLVLHNTDSVFVQLPRPSEPLARVVEYNINEELRRFARTYGAKRPPEVKFERLFLRILFKTSEKGAVKKRYAGVTTDGVLYIIGFEPRRSDTAELTRTLMKEFFKKLLIDDDERGAIQMVRNAWMRMPEMPIQTIAIPKSLKKAEYKVKNPWLEGVQTSQKLFGWKFREDQRPRLVYVKRINGKPAHAVCLTEDITELPSGVEVDWSKMREVVIRRKFEGILSALGYDWTVITSGTRQMTLGEMFAT